MSFNNDRNNYKFIMNNKLSRKETGFHKTERTPIDSNEQVNFSSKKSNNNENNSINNNLEKDKHILLKGNTHKMPSNSVNKKDSPFFSRETIYLGTTKELTSQYDKTEEKKKISENTDNLYKSEMKDTKKKGNENYIISDKIRSKYSYSKEKNVDVENEKRNNEIYIKSLNKKYMKSPKEKNKRSYEEFNDKMHKEYNHNLDKKSFEMHHSITKKFHERKRSKNSPEIYDNRMDSRKREKKIEILHEKSQYMLNYKKERANSSGDSGYFSKEKKKNLKYKEPKFINEEWEKNTEKHNRRNFERTEKVLCEKNKSYNKLSDQNYNNYIDKSKIKNHTNIKEGKEISNKKYMQKESANKYSNENENYDKEKRKKREPNPNRNEEKYIKTEQKKIEEKRVQERSSLKEEDSTSKRNMENINTHIRKSKSEQISEQIIENTNEHTNENTSESINESRNSSINEKCKEKNESESSSTEEDIVEECETPNEYSSDSEKNKVECILNGCRSVKNYKKLNKISEGTYGTVFRAQNKKTKKIVALKQLKHFSSIQNEGFAITSLREINILLQLEHENILSIKEVVIGKHLNDIYLVMEYIEHELKILLDNKSPSFTISELKCLLKQLLSGINYLHTNWVMHRDLKPTNLLYSNRGILKICDFGMSRKFGHITIHNLTKNVVTLWYRAPELLLGEKCYTNKIDIWSVGCIFAEMILKKPLFIGDNEYEQIMKILSLLGLPDKESYPEFYEYAFISKNKDLFKKKKIKMNVNNMRSYFPNVANQFSGLYLSDNGLDLLQKLLHFNPKNRISAAEALNHPYFKEFPKPTEINEMPIIPDTNKVIRSSKMARHINLLNQKNIQFHS